MNSRTQSNERLGSAETILRNDLPEILLETEDESAAKSSIVITAIKEAGGNLHRSGEAARLASNEPAPHNPQIEVEIQITGGPITINPHSPCNLIPDRSSA